VPLATPIFGGSGFRNHVLDRHADSPISWIRWPHKPKFPFAWSADDIFQAIEYVMERSDEVRHYGDQFQFRGVVREVAVHVSVRVDKPRPFVWAGYPAR